MKPKDGSVRKPVSSASGSPMWNSRLPMEWMDPMSWRLPSGKALAEFALQAGFLAPLMMGGPGIRKKKLGPKPVPPPVTPPAVYEEKQWREGPGSSGTFRETR
jgi:hypothetical protein